MCLYQDGTGDPGIPAMPSNFNVRCTDRCENTQLCYTGDSTAKLVDGMEKRMDQLKKNDWVLTVGETCLTFEQVEYWLHRLPEKEAIFNKFETVDGRTIKITDKHYIYKGDCSRVATGPVPLEFLPKEAVFADQVRVGDCLFTVGDCLFNQMDRSTSSSRIITSRSWLEAWRDLIH
ncbi:hypothetical protein PENTCL1PPCAC_28753 [Pristionchus entomophagus]|uniref:Hint domain-containing protein n=1 Tax=Pristionchus entomophagus TaxID=358040 RepID=A0AAV5UKX1_9BILA|nr:hypothetical protein PENTCL1PPCAC_28753 [Pristionchus entomophagus]